MMRRHNRIFCPALVILIALAATCFSSDTPDPDIPQFNIDIDANGTDPIGIRNINGFYGPGSWTAWFLTFICAMFGGSDLSMVSYFLYTAFANLDALIRIIRINPQDEKLVLETELGPLAAAYTIIAASVVYNTAIWINRIGLGSPYTSWQHWIYQFIGMLSTSLVYVLFTGTLSVHGNRPYMFTSATINAFLSPVCAGSQLGKSRGRDYYSSFLVFLGLGSAANHLLLSLNAFGKFPETECFIPGSPLLFFFAWVLYGFGILLCMLLYLICAVDCWSSDTTYYQFRPYTHHRVQDLDQLFALFLGVATFIWEFGLIEALLKIAWFPRRRVWGGELAEMPVTV